jgi:hypothetical protein
MLGAPAIPACDPAGPAEPATRARERGLSASPGVEPAPAAPPGRRGRLFAGERVERIPQWPAPATIDDVVHGRLPESAQAAVSRSPVPVLAPTDAPLVAEAAVFSGPWGYALSARHGERTLAVQASKIATLLPHVGHVPGNTRLRGVDGWISINDGIRTAAWIEHGTAYSLDLECFAADGPECSEAALRAAVEGLVYVGGSGAVRPRGGAR